MPVGGIRCLIGVLSLPLHGDSFNFFSHMYILLEASRVLGSIWFAKRPNISCPSLYAEVAFLFQDTTIEKVK